MVYPPPNLSPQYLAQGLLVNNELVFNVLLLFLWHMEVLPWSVIPVGVTYRFGLVQNVIIGMSWEKSTFSAFGCYWIPLGPHIVSIKHHEPNQTATYTQCFMFLLNCMCYSVFLMLFMC